MTAQVPTMEPYHYGHHQYDEHHGAESFLITPEKLEELKSRIPRAGPKYRLGMYFETIHDLSDFEEVNGPSEDGYSSCWETETEFDSELGNFIFHNVTGDSASVICIDEAMDLLAMREQQQEMQLQMEETRRKAAVCEDVGPDLAKLGPGDLEEYTFDRPADGKRSGGASRHSHHSGSDGTYDGPQQAPIHHHTTIVATPLPDEPVECKEDHIYETLDACQDHHFQMYISKGSYHHYSDTTTSAVPPKLPPGHGSDNDSLGRKNAALKTASIKSVFGVKSRTTQPEHQQMTTTTTPKRERMNLKKKNSLDSNERGVQVAPKQYPSPLKGYGFEKSHMYGRSSQEKVTNSNLPASSQNSAPPSLLIKHKGKTYVIPVVERKKEGRSRQNSSSSKRVHNVLCTNVQNNTPHHTNTYVPPPPQSATYCSVFANGGPAVVPKKLSTPSQANGEHFEGNRRRKMSVPNSVSLAPSSKHSTAATTVPNRVTHYGML